MSCKIDPILITDSLNTAREKINDVYTGRTEIWSGSTGFQSIVSRGDDTNSSSSNYSVVLGGKNNSITGLIGDGKNVIIGGENNSIENNSLNSAIIGGQNNILSGTSNSAIVGGSNITGVTDNTTFVPDLNSTGFRVRSTRYLTLEPYVTGMGKVPAINADDEILLITDNSIDTGPPTSAYLSLDLRFMISDDQIGRTVELVMIDNTGFLGGILLGSSQSDFRINNEVANASFLFCTGLYQHVTVTYLGNIGYPWFAVTGTGA
tara:strand:- start:2198 stop:2986 length:789 start_codon:yes stop_codon:yes gene_type:complete